MDAQARRPAPCAARRSAAAVDALGLVDESAGYHARHTAWRWSAGVGVAESGEPVAWNLVDGTARRLAVGADRVGGRRAARGRCRSRSTGCAGSAASASPPRPRASRRENLLIASSDYEQPFGSFAGELPVAGPLREGWGVMERHDVRW